MIHHYLFPFQGVIDYVASRQIYSNYPIYNLVINARENPDLIIKKSEIVIFIIINNRLKLHSHFLDVVYYGNSSLCMLKQTSVAKRQALCM